MAWSRQVKNRQVLLCLVDHLQQLLKDLTDSWRVPWAVRGMKCQDCDGSRQLLKGHQGIPLEFLGNGSGGEWRHELPCDCFWCSHALKGSKEISRSPAYAGGLWGCLMGLELLLAVGIPILLLLSGTLYFAARGQLPQVLKRLTSRDAILWNTLVGLMITAGVVRYLMRNR